MQTIFELDKSDLDFGIYRIMNIRKNEIENFLKEGLPSKVKECLIPFAQNTNDIKSRIVEIEKACDEVGIDISESKMAKEYDSLNKGLISGIDISALETDVYSALYSFFNRYYEEGDFISKRRYKDGVYAIPYEGEEVKLYWANHDQYYIKTSENFKDYTFQDSGMTVHFRLVDASIEKDNNQENSNTKRVFMLFEESEDYPGIKTFEQNGTELIIRFVFDVPADKKQKHFEINAQAISNAIISTYRDFNGLLRDTSTDPKKFKSVIEKHLESYVAKNTFDYFIHKDLRSFLSRELDFYIKNEIIHLDDLDTFNEKHVESYLAKVKAIKRVGKIIIDFLAQIEDFQKKLWLKKKFVIDTNWCITLSKIDEAFYPEIIKNKDQIQEWIKMYAINEIERNLEDENVSEFVTVDFLLENQNLIIDTKHFTKDFKERLIASLENIDDQTNGLMVHSENFQALNFLEERFSNQIELVYIDPPYNTDASKILYKNGYEHSSWISLMHSRLEAAKILMSEKGIIEVAIDDYEFRYINSCLDQVFGINNAISNIAIFTNPKGRDQEFIAQAHDYTLLYAKNKKIAETNNFLLSEEELKKKFSKTKGEDAIRELPLKRTGSAKRREDRPSMYFPFIYNPLNGDFNVVPEEEYKKIYDPLTDTFDDGFVHSLQEKYEKKGYIFLLPLSKKKEKLRWRWGYKSCREGAKNGILFVKHLQNEGGYAVYQYDIADNQVKPKSMWIGERYDASSKGTNLLENMIPNNPFDYPKSIYTVEDNIIIGSNDSDIVLDFFAGSGTTGHAVIDLNRTIEESQRKYILVEMGEYFDKVTKSRIKKAIYSSEWKNGKPVNRDTGLPHIMKYLHLESYEDTLTNIELSDNGEQMRALFGEEYLINYMLNIEAEGSLLKLARFNTPFDYQMKVMEKNETIEKSIDLVETFNYLIGLAVTRQSVTTYFNATIDKNGMYEGAVKLEEDIKGSYGFKQVEGILPDGRRALIIWRNITDDLIESNAALDTYFKEYKINKNNCKYDIIYINGDNNLENLRLDNENWKVHMTEIEFNKRMFEGV